MISHCLCSLLFTSLLASVVSDITTPSLGSTTNPSETSGPSSTVTPSHVLACRELDGNCRSGLLPCTDNEVAVPYDKRCDSGCGDWWVSCGQTCCVNATSLQLVSTISSQQQSAITRGLRYVAVDGGCLFVVAAVALSLLRAVRSRSDGLTESLLPSHGLETPE